MFLAATHADHVWGRRVSYVSSTHFRPVFVSCVCQLDGTKVRIPPKPLKPLSLDSHGAPTSEHSTIRRGTPTETEARNDCFKSLPVTFNIPERQLKGTGRPKPYESLSSAGSLEVWRM